MNLKQALIENNSIRLGLEAADWKEVVKLAVEPQFYQSTMMRLLSQQKNMVPTIF